MSNKWTTPMFSPQYLAAMGHGQVLAVICCRCKMVWEMRSPSRIASEQEAIMSARDDYHYKMTRSGPVCDKCQEEDREREATR